MATLNEQPSSERAHIAFFGVRNAGKSSLMNAISNQDLSIVSPVRGTTTDPVRKTMELQPAGPVVLIDTPGIDDVGSLGEERIKKANQVLQACDIAVLVIDCVQGIHSADKQLLSMIAEEDIPAIVVVNKCDKILNDSDIERLKATIRKRITKIFSNNLNKKISTEDACEINIYTCSSKNGGGIEELKDALAKMVLLHQSRSMKPLVSDLIDDGSVLVLVIPLDGSAPKGRIILPQQMVLRDALESGVIVACCQPEQLMNTLEKFDIDRGWQNVQQDNNNAGNNTKGNACFVVTDSQVFDFVSHCVPPHIPLTSFSILMARYRGDLLQLVQGTTMLDKLKDNAKVLISEACTHHRQCEDIGSVKIPALISNYTGKELSFSFTSGRDFPQDLQHFDLIVHCGACMNNKREMMARLKRAQKQGVPITNYGMVIAKCNGILDRALEPLNRPGEYITNTNR